MSTPVFSKPSSPRKRPPLWLRVLLLTVLFLFAGLAFFLNFDKVIEELYPDRAIESEQEEAPTKE